MPEIPEGVDFNQGGAYQFNPSTKDYYTKKSKALGDDIKFLDDAIRNTELNANPLKDQAAPFDKQLADSVVNYNTQLNIIKAKSDAAITCGCSFVYDILAGAATTQSIFYEECLADKKNLNSSGYGGDDPLGDNGDIAIVSKSSPTTVVTGSLGDGQDIDISTASGTGSSVTYFRIIDIEPFGSCGNCQTLYAEQTAAISAASTIQSNPIRSPAESKSNAIKTEREFLLRERWTLSFARKETVDTKSRIDGYNASTNPT